MTIDEFERPVRWRVADHDALVIARLQAQALHALGHQVQRPLGLGAARKHLVEWGGHQRGGVQLGLLQAKRDPHEALHVDHVARSPRACELEQPLSRCQDGGIGLPVRLAVPFCATIQLFEHPLRRIWLDKVVTVRMQQEQKVRGKGPFGRQAMTVGVGSEPIEAFGTGALTPQQVKKGLTERCLV